MNKIKRISASIMVCMLALCVTYFSTMSPTSAWFYDGGVIDSGDTFVFGDLSVNTNFTVNSPIDFDGATTPFDDGEILFDEVANIDIISVKNTGTIPARIYANIKGIDKSAALKWFVYTDDMLVNNSIKETIRATISQLNYEALSEYNIGADGNSGKYFIIQPNESVDVKIATWVDYDSVIDKLSTGTLNYDVEIELIATQDVDGAVKR